MANAITLMRVLIALFVLIIIKMNPLMNSLAIFLIMVSMLLDAADGYVARRLKTFTVHGSVYDILADRIIENIFFIYFAAMSLFSIWFALIMMVRGLSIDAVRTIFASDGKTAFGATTFHQYEWTKLLTCSKMSRGTYNTAKLITFICFGALLEPKGMIFKFIPYQSLHSYAVFSLYVTITIGILRAIPVLVEGLKPPKILDYTANSDN